MTRRREDVGGIVTSIERWESRDPVLGDVAWIAVRRDEQEESP